MRYCCLRVLPHYRVLLSPFSFVLLEYIQYCRDNHGHFVSTLVYVLSRWVLSNVQCPLRYCLSKNCQCADIFAFCIFLKIILRYPKTEPFFSLKSKHCFSLFKTHKRQRRGEEENAEEYFVCFRLAALQQPKNLAKSWLPKQAGGGGSMTKHFICYMYNVHWL